MKLVIQRSGKSQVFIENKLKGEISKGLVVFVCFEGGDEKIIIEKAVKKLIDLRCFDDEETGKMNKSVLDIEGQILLVSQFTLSWNGSRGNRPSFDNSMEPQLAKVFYRSFCDQLRKHIHLETGEFGKMMNVRIENQGPVTFFLEF